jgi:hypothetical protein
VDGDDAHSPARLQLPGGFGLLPPFLYSPFPFFFTATDSLGWQSSRRFRDGLRSTDGKRVLGAWGGGPGLPPFSLPLLLLLFSDSWWWRWIWMGIRETG